MPSSAARLFISSAKLVLGAADALGERDRRVVARLDDQPAQQVLDAHLAVDVEEHRRAVARGAPPVRQAYSETVNLSSRWRRPSFSSRNTISAVISLTIAAGADRRRRRSSRSSTAPLSKSSSSATGAAVWKLCARAPARSARARTASVTRRSIGEPETERNHATCAGAGHRRASLVVALRLRRQSNATRFAALRLARHCPRSARVCVGLSRRANGSSLRFGLRREIERAVVRSDADGRHGGFAEAAGVMARAGMAAPRSNGRDGGTGGLAMRRRAAAFRTPSRSPPARPRAAARGAASRSTAGGGGGGAAEPSGTAKAPELCAATITRIRSRREPVDRRGRAVGAQAGEQFPVVGAFERRAGRHTRP